MAARRAAVERRQAAPTSVLPPDSRAARQDKRKCKASNDNAE